MQRITSRQNPRLKEAIRLLASARDRRKAGRCVLEGEHLVAVYAERCGPPETLVVSEAFLERATARTLAERFAERTLVVPVDVFAGLATLPVGVGMIAVVTTPRSDAPARAADFCLLLDDIQDPGNVGSILRTAAAAGVGEVLLSKHCAFAWSPKVLRAGQGAHFHVGIREDVDLPAWAAAYRDRGGDVVACVATGGASLFATPLTGRLALVIGNEGAGIAPALAAVANRRVTIPMPGRIESLNAAAAAAVCLFEAVRQRQPGPVNRPTA